MHLRPPGAGIPPVPQPLSRAPRHVGVAAFAALSIFLCSGATYPSCSGSIGPSKGEVVGVAVGVGAVIAVVTVVAVNASHHSLTGCVVNGPNGLNSKPASPNGTRWKAMPPASESATASRFTAPV